MSYGKRACGYAVGRELAAGVETEPAEPKHTGAQHRVGEVMRRHGNGAEAQPFTDHQGANQRRHAGADMDHSSAGEIERSARTYRGRICSVGQNAAVPNPMAQRAIDKCAPKDHEHHHGAEFHSFGKSAANQGRRNDEEHSLKEHVRKPRYGTFHGNDRLPVGPLELHVSHSEKFEVSEISTAATERKRVAPQCPNHGHHGHEEHTLHHYADDVFFADQPAIKHGQPRRGHKQDQSRGNQHPGIIAER